MPYFFLIVSFTLNGIANLILRHASLNEPALNIKDLNLAFIGDHKWFIFGLTLFASNIFFYMIALRYFSVSVAYPIMVAMTLIIVATGAHFLFKENISGVQLLGYVLLIIAVYLVSAKRFMVQ